MSEFASKNDLNWRGLMKNYDVRLTQSMSQQAMADQLSKLGNLKGAPIQKQAIENGEKVIYLRNPNALDKLKQAFSRNDKLQMQRAPALAMIHEKFGFARLSDQALQRISDMFARGRGNAGEVARAMMTPTASP